MNLRDWNRARSTIHDRVYDDLVATAGCGAFDGGCVVIAEALQRVIGGSIVVLHREDGTADHAAVLADNKLWDYDGPMRPHGFIKRFIRNELVGSPFTCTGYRPIEPSDLRQAYRDSDLVERVATLFHEALEPYGFRLTNDPAPEPSP